MATQSMQLHAHGFSARLILADNLNNVTIPAVASTSAPALTAKPLAATSLPSLSSLDTIPSQHRHSSHRTYATIGEVRQRCIHVEKKRLDELVATNQLTNRNSSISTIGTVGDVDREKEIEEFVTAGGLLVAPIVLPLEQVIPWRYLPTSSPGRYAQHNDEVKDEFVFTSSETHSKLPTVTPSFYPLSSLLIHSEQFDAFGSLLNYYMEWPIRQSAKFLSNSLRGLFEYKHSAPHLSKSSPVVRQIAYHPRSPLLSILVRSPNSPHDSYLYTCKLSTTSKVLHHQWDSIVLSEPRMQNAVTFAFSPISGRQFAVGCQNGICIWSFSSYRHLTQSFAQTTKPHFAFLSIKSLHDVDSALVVNSVAWSPCGQFIAAVAAPSFVVYVWDAFKAISEGHLANPTIITSLSPVQHIRWSNQPSKLLVFHSTHLEIYQMDALPMIPPVRTFTFSNLMKSTASTSTVAAPPASSLSLSSIINSIPAFQFGNAPDHTLASKDGDFVLFAYSTSPIITAISLRSEASSLQSTFTIDCSASQRVINDTPVSIGGYISAMTWSPSNSRLVVAFNNCQYLAIFETSILLLLKATLIGVIVSGHEYPSTSYPLNFSWKSFARGELLSIVWSHGLITSHHII